ncbi:lysophospholipid acyltransferase family protein [Mucilaginibacter sp. UR6-1]|uniref:lysophospholipid acyltransferase family protein n=1 Tax=Mucilaginibacter sp. UR6-1 TaxID=1435643 RepID=UPI001E488965|nr:lysophospholipid acyltransferase family protein [Mucilaginibacter sp. UR6-1]MCC8407642.1 lysophospholipid acyltransferase family protein [Mucilaginibacter sp. UR6-1]
MINKGLSYIGIGFLYLVSLLPFWFLYLIADVLFVVIYYVTGYRRKVVQQNLRNAFPEKSDEEREKIERDFFRYFADLIVEIIKGITLSERQIIKRIKILNADLINGYFEQGRNVIGAVGHYGNWEMSALSLGVITDKPRIIVYKPLSNKLFERFFIYVRSRFGATLVAMKNTLRKLSEVRRQISITVLVADQTPVRHEAHYFTTFLNQPTAVFLGVEKLAKMMDAVVVFCDLKLVKRGHYTCTFVPLTENPKQTAEYEVTELHVKYLENMIRQEPRYWLWTHKRWKFKPEDKH